MTKPFLDIHDLVAETGMSTSFWRKAIQKKKIKVHRFGDAVRISREALTEYLRERETAREVSN